MGSAIVMILVIVVSITAYQEEEEQKEIVSLEELEKCMQIIQQISHPNEMHLKQYDDCIENASSSQNP